MTARQAMIEDVIGRAAGRRVFGYSSDDGHGGEMLSQGRCAVVGIGPAEQRKLFSRIDRICIEGESKPWQNIPKGE